MPVERVSLTEGRFSLPIVHPDGQILTYRILVREAGTSLCAVEDATAPLLPRFCPDRHVVGDGEFCLYWKGAQTFDVFDDESAAVWLGVLSSFLLMQKRAAYARRWPNAETWAHGVPAAKAQQRAEKIGSAIDREWPSLILEQRVNVQRGADKVYRVELDGDFLYSAWRVFDHRAKDRKPILKACQTTTGGRRLVSNPARVKQLFGLAAALWEWKTEEEKFWQLFRGHPCCGTMDTCGLRGNECQT